MNPEAPTTPLSPGAADAPCLAPAEPVPADGQFERLFRHTLKAGEVNPLLLIVPLYRQEAAP